LFKDLIILSAIDGETGEEEVTDLLHFCAEIGVELKNFKYVLQNIKPLTLTLKMKKLVHTNLDSYDL